MSNPIRLLVVLFAFLFARHASADEKIPVKAAKPAEERRAALVKAGYTAIPLSLKPREKYFYIDGAVGPERVKFFLDSGSTEMFIDPIVAQRLKLKLGKEAESIGLDGKQSSRLTQVPRLRIGSYDIFKDIPLFPCRVAEQPSGQKGVLGIQLLESWGAVVDYSAQTMYLRSPLVNAWPRLAGTWDVTSWIDDGTALKFDTPATLTFANRRLKMTDDGVSMEFSLQYMPNGARGDMLFLSDTKNEGQFEGGGLIKSKDGRMTICLLIAPDVIGPDKKRRDIPKEFASPKGSGYQLLELKRISPKELKLSPDPLRELLLKHEYYALSLDRESNGLRSANARIGEHELRLMVDTGASWSGFDAAGLNKWGAVRLGKIETNAGLGLVTGEEMNLRGLKLGGYDTRRTFGKVYGLGIDLTGLNRFLVEQKIRPIQGVLGNLDLLTGSAIIDFGTNTLYLRPVKETLWPQLEGKWVGVAWEANGKKGRYSSGDAAVEFKDGRVGFVTKDAAAEWGFHLRDEGDRYRVGLFDPKADELADGFKYASGGLLKLSGDKISLVMEQGKVCKEPTEFAAPAGSGLLLVEYERAK